MKAFIICLKEFESSMFYAEETKKQCTTFGFKPDFFYGVNGDKALKNVKKEKRQPDQENLLKKHSGICHKTLLTDFPGVIGCFYSHHSLWKHCVQLNEPIFIFEDDVNFYNNYTHIDHSGIVIVSIHEKMNDILDHNNFTFSASGYSITPNVANLLLKRYNNTYDAADWCILNSVCNTVVHPRPIAKKISEKEKPSLTMFYNEQKLIQQKHKGFIYE
jgi:GR25 family glycosyltransferase involved in LPS biosynthesis